MTEAEESGKLKKITLSAINKANSLLTGQIVSGILHTVGDSVGDVLKDSLLDKAEEKAAVTFVGSTVGEVGKAEKEFVSELGGWLLTTAINVLIHGASAAVTAGAAAPVTVLLHVILYIDAKDKQERKKRAKEIAESIQSKYDNILAKAQARLEKKHELEVERIILSNAAHDKHDGTAAGLYVAKGKWQTVTKGDIVQVRTILTTKNEKEFEKVTAIDTQEFIIVSALSDVKIKIPSNVTLGDALDDKQKAAINKAVAKHLSSHWEDADNMPVPDESEK